MLFGAAGHVSASKARRIYLACSTGSSNEGSCVVTQRKPFAVAARRMTEQQLWRKPTVQAVAYPVHHSIIFFIHHLQIPVCLIIVALHRNTWTFVFCYQVAFLKGMVLYLLYPPKQILHLCGHLQEFLGSYLLSTSCTYHYVAEHIAK